MFQRWPTLRQLSLTEDQVFVLPALHHTDSDDLQFCDHLQDAVDLVPTTALHALHSAQTGHSLPDLRAYQVQRRWA